ncbi:MAG: hypothetical protein SGPRY_005944 [Prymnesium sp.]
MNSPPLELCRVVELAHTDDGEGGSQRGEGERVGELAGDHLTYVRGSGCAARLFAARRKVRACCDERPASSEAEAQRRSSACKGLLAAQEAIAFERRWLDGFKSYEELEYLELVCGVQTKL